MYLRTTLDGVRTEFSINRHVDTKEWNDQSRRLNGRYSESEVTESYLDTVAFRVYEYHNK
jgi:hypothetical protein